ncbi:MAG TPA: arginine N-succinyltransferase, partial [Polyangia bacterium]|nr:arginine N-succinyltransferase [Polyangia bacterium]
PLEPDGTSLLWEALGRKFTGLSYQEADRLSQTNKEFIRALFPQDPIYATLLPAPVQAVIGEVGPRTKGVEKLLREVGFAYQHRIDPFDGGPHFHARTDDITLVKAVRAVPVADAAQAPIDAGGRRQVFLVARERPAPPCFVVARIELPSLPEGERVSLPEDVRRALEVTAGDEVAVLRIS